MSTKHAEIWAALAAPFSKDEVKSRTQGGRQLQYVTAPTVANRLDEVLGPENWDFELTAWGDDALIGTLIVRLPDGTVVRKSNVGGTAGMQAGDDDAKSAASDCLKRCAVLMGPGRYLYRDGVPQFVRDIVKGEGRKAPAPAPAGGDAPPPPADPQDLLEPGRFRGWLPAFIRKANATFAEAHPHLDKVLPTLVDRDMLLSYLADWAGDVIPVDAKGEVLLEALGMAFDAGPEDMHAAARDLYKQRLKSASAIRKGLAAAS